MIEREANNLRINRLRVVNKFEADYNLVLTYFRPHVATHRSEKHNKLDKISRVLIVFSTDSTIMIDEIVTEIHRINCKSSDTTAY